MNEELRGHFGHLQTILISLGRRALYNDIGIYSNFKHKIGFFFTL